MVPLPDIINSSQTPVARKTRVSAEIEKTDSRKSFLPYGDEMKDDGFCIPSSQKPVSAQEIVPSSQTQSIIPESPFTPHTCRTISSLPKNGNAKGSNFDSPDTVWHFNIPSTQEFTLTARFSQPNTPIEPGKTKIYSGFPERGPCFSLPSTKEVSIFIPSSQAFEKLPSAALHRVFDQAGIAGTAPSSSFDKEVFLDSTVNQPSASYFDSDYRDNAVSVNDCSVIPETPNRDDDHKAFLYVDRTERASNPQSAKSSPMRKSTVTSSVARFFAMLDETRDFSMSGSSVLYSQFSSCSSEVSVVDSQFSASFSEEDDRLELKTQ
jgi:hypothetical protein